MLQTQYRGVGTLPRREAHDSLARRDRRAARGGKTPPCHSSAARASATGWMESNSPAASSSDMTGGASSRLTEFDPAARREAMPEARFDRWQRRHRDQPAADADSSKQGQFGNRWCLREAGGGAAWRALAGGGGHVHGLRGPVAGRLSGRAPTTCTKPCYSLPLPRSSPSSQPRNRGAGAASLSDLPFSMHAPLIDPGLQLEILHCRRLSLHVVVVSYRIVSGIVVRNSGLLGMRRKPHGNLGLGAPFAMLCWCIFGRKQPIVLICELGEY
jgi:hypothetical protein